MITLVGLMASFLWLLRYRFRHRFLRAYGLFFLILLIYGTNKTAYGISEEMSEGAFSPLSLVRWAALGVLVFAALRMRMPPRLRPDIPLAALIVLLLCYILLSSTYAENFRYSFLRALSFTLLAIVMLVGMAYYFHHREHCLDYFRFKYYAAWIAIAPMMLLHLVGLDSLGVTILIGQYAGLFGNQNMLGTFSALVTPYVLFHRQVVARTARQRAFDLGLLGLTFVGIWLSGSRGGLLSYVIGVATYYFVVNLESRLKIVAATICLITGIILFPNLRHDIERFVRKSATQTEDGRFTSQITEEKRYAMWSGVWPIFWKEKLTGYGFASSHVHVAQFTRDENVNLGRSVHNSYLEIFGDLGLPGATLLLLILYRISMKAVVLIRRPSSDLDRNIHAAFIAILMAGSVNAFFESWMFSVGNLLSLMYWGPVAGVVARWAWRPALQPAQPSVTRPGLSHSGGAGAIESPAPRKLKLAR
jgi:hypothetical protein